MGRKFNKCLGTCWCPALAQDHVGLIFGLYLNWCLNTWMVVYQHVACLCFCKVLNPWSLGTAARNSVTGPWKQKLYINAHTGRAHVRDGRPLTMMVRLGFLSASCTEDLFAFESLPPHTASISDAFSSVCALRRLTLRLADAYGYVFCSVLQTLPSHQKFFVSVVQAVPSSHLCSCLVCTTAKVEAAKGTAPSASDAGKAHFLEGNGKGRKLPGNNRSTKTTDERSIEADDLEPGEVAEDRPQKKRRRRSKGQAAGDIGSGDSGDAKGSAAIPDAQKQTRDGAAGGGAVQSGKVRKSTHLHGSAIVDSVDERGGGEVSEAAAAELPGQASEKMDEAGSGNGEDDSEIETEDAEGGLSESDEEEDGEVMGSDGSEQGGSDSEEDEEDVDFWAPPRGMRWDGDIDKRRWGKK